jgi:hypothetical protein
MAEVPKIVRERLFNQAATGEHPDANLLSAFSEHGLSEQERARVLDHLSRCAECREVVALSALSQVDEEQLVAAGRGSAGASRSWWQSPIVHWSALTAAALVVLIAVGERMRLRPEHSASAPAIAKYEPAEKQPASAPATAPAPPQQKQPQKLAETAKPPRRTQAFNAPQPMGAVSGRKVASGDRVATGSAIGGSAGVGGHNLPPPAALPMKPHANADAAATTIDGPSFESAHEQAQAKAAPAPSAAAKESVEISAAAAPAPKPEAIILPQRPPAVNFTKRAFLGPRWSVSDSGALQRSFDGGRSWKDVAVAEGVSFRAVAVVVIEVWAGGSGGALFHSADGGEHWARVRVQANDRTPSGDILRIEFADAQNGVVTTSTGETWRTSDAGLTWRWQ